MAIGTTVFVVVYRMEPGSNQEEQEFSTRSAAEDYKNTVHLLGGIAIIVTKFVPIGEMK